MKRRKWTIIFLLQAALLTQTQAQKNSIPEIKKFRFKATQTKTLPGLIAESELTSALNDEEQIGTLVLPLSRNANGYVYKDGSYNHSQYQVEQGEVSDELGQTALPAYRVFPPSKKAEEFVASMNTVFIKFPTAESYTVYQLNGDQVTKIVEIAAKSGYTKISDLVATNFKEPLTFFYSPSKNKISIFMSISPDIEAGQLLSNKFFKVVKYRYSAPESPYDFVMQSDHTRKYFLSKTDGDKIALVWQSKNRDKIYSSVFSRDLKSISTNILDNNQAGELVAACTSPNETTYYVTINSTRPSGSLNRIKPGEPNPARQALSFAKADLNIYAYDGDFADLEYSRDTLLFMIARTMHASKDGLNHQGGIAVTFNANTLQTVKHYGQTSGHSFDNLATLNTQEEFIAMDLGDNYPRGVNLHMFKNRLRSKVVYTFKTAHGVTADCWGIATYPEYTEISTKEKKYYRWSNDNNTYTELGGIVDTGDGYLVSFCGEPDEKGLSLDNGKSGMPMPRNVGFVKVVKNYFDISEGTSSEISEKMVLSNGISEKGGFYTFGGKWSPQKNNGVVWLTKYQSAEQKAQHLKTVGLANGKILFVWELQTETDRKTFALITNSKGKTISDVIDLGANVNLQRRDEPLVIGNKVIFAGGNQTDQVLELVVLEVN